MASRYEKADKPTIGLMDDVLATYYPDILTHEVKIDVLFAFAPENDEGERVGTALKMHGYATNALTRVINLRDRVKGMGDAEITLDGDTWDSLNKSQQTAIMDHQLQYLVLRRSHEGELLTDTHGRPKLSLRQHSRQFGWFDVVAKRNGTHSIEVTQASQLFVQAGQVYFGFINPELKGLAGDEDKPEDEE